MKIEIKILDDIETPYQVYIDGTQLNEHARVEGYHYKDYYYSEEDAIKHLIKFLMDYL
jgi:hypothetical protein